MFRNFVWFNGILYEKKKKDKQIRWPTVTSKDVCFSFFFACLFVYCFLNLKIVTEYMRMPEMFKLDDYDDCFLGAEENKHATYCVVKSLIKPNESSEIWKIVEVWVYHFSNQMLHLSFKNWGKKTCKHLHFPIDISIQLIWYLFCAKHFICLH